MTGPYRTALPMPACGVRGGCEAPAVCRRDGACLARELEAAVASGGQTGASEGSAAPGGEETEVSFSHFVGEPHPPRAEGPVQPLTERNGDR